MKSHVLVFFFIDIVIFTDKWMLIEELATWVQSIYSVPSDIGHSLVLAATLLHMLAPQITLYSCFAVADYSVTRYWADFECFCNLFAPEKMGKL